MNLSLVKVAVCTEDKNDIEYSCEGQGVNKAGLGVAMNNTVPATPLASASVVPSNTANLNVNNIQLDDVQKLQQQLQDIKEQVMLL